MLVILLLAPASYSLDTTIFSQAKTTPSLNAKRKIKKIRISKVLSYLAPYTETGPRVLNSFVGVFNLPNRLGEVGL